MNRFHPSALRRLSGLALMEILVVVAVIIALAAIAVPVWNVFETRANKAAAEKVMRALGSATLNYTGQHDGQLPSEDAPGATNWEAAADPKNAEVWFNALPKLMGRKTVGDFSSNPSAYYTKDNPIYLPGAPYPTNDTRLLRPLFAISFNSKLERKSVSGDKVVKMADITNPSRTVLFLEEGLPKEKRTVETQPRYDGQAKGSARSFVGRYGGKGWLTFCDGHSELVEPKDTLDVTGQILQPETNYIWTLQR
jgi:type II secretory pathway pseudopilin PulG